jgi:transposase
LESKFRAAKIGERNWMFVGHPEAGDNSAVLYTLLACCRIHRIEPRSYLVEVLERLVAAEHHPEPELVESLLPWNWAVTHLEALVKEPPRL